MDSVFEAAMATVLAHEGGYVFDKSDPGGATKYGISKRQYPNEDIANLTVERAKAIYFGDYWLRYHIGQLPGVSIPVKIMDTAVLAGPRTAILLLQNALNDCGAHVLADGAIGQQTADACRGTDTTALLARYRALLADHYRLVVADNPGQTRFLGGWLARAAA